ncbi:protein kinase, partial [Pseudofrankia sp. BMG5.36]|uniref:protein kinase domain-containing protein n=1 Tax=Pseudofrankia sp. BMG5.36 TaxID=1834512 RepID=UPI0009F66A58
MTSTLGADHVGSAGGVLPAPANAASGAEPPWEVVFTPLAPDDPREIGGYRLRARIGQGGMGAVYFSYTLGGQPVALKVARPEIAADPEFRRRFASEVAIAQRVQGVYTASVIDADPHAVRPWLATAYVAGPSLAVVLARHGPLPVNTVLVLLAGVAEALCSIHSAGVIHRDLKPGNIILAGGGPRVIDFGIARAVEAATTALTRTGAWVGTPAFMPPEQVRGQQLDTAGDVFSLGATAYYAATGALPFGSDAAVFHRIMNEQPDWDRCPVRIRGVLQQCVAKDPAARPATAALIELCREASVGEWRPIGEGWLPPTVTADLTRYSLTPPEPPPGPSSTAEAVRSRSPEPATPAAPDRPGRRRSFWLAGALGAAVLAATLAVTFLVVSNKGSDQSKAGRTATAAALVNSSADAATPGNPASGGVVADNPVTAPMTAPAANTSASSSTAAAGASPAGSGIIYSAALKNQNSGLCIGDSVSQGLRHNTCNGGAYQRWKLTHRSDGSYQ